MADNSDDTGTYEVINPPNTLKERMGAGAGFDAVLTERAQAAVEAIEEGNLQSLTAYLDELTELLERADKFEDGMSVYYSEVVRVLKEMETQGAKRGYPLMSNISRSLFDYLEVLEVYVETDDEVVVAHIDALRAVIGNEIQGDGGPIGQDLLQSLKILVEKTVALDDE